MKYRENRIYQLIFRHPRIFIAILVLGGISIIYYFVSFINAHVI